MTKHYTYETVKGDPLKTRIYTLGNGLRVFLTRYDESPRIQTYIAVRTGSKMDPPETTGLAHYFEHMMFKGTEHFGTIDWAAEKPLIGKIEALFEVYRKEKDTGKRASIYGEIDRLSYQASLLAIPNEYDKLMDAIGSQGSNAGTSNDYTIFMENIPSGQVGNWVLIEADRFSKPVLRLFHTELETVYEEKNMSLTNDNRRVNEAMMALLFPNHPYGTQTTLGEAEHLKNPSMKNIREFFSTYYVPGNMAICMSGDLDPEKTIRLIDRHFGLLRPAPVPTLRYREWQPLNAPLWKEITGLEAENIRIGYGFDIKARQEESLMLTMISTLLSNGTAGLIDLNLNQSQKVLTASAYDNQLDDYGMIVLNGRPKTNQTLDEVKKLLLDQVELLKKGMFPGWMLEAAVNNARLDVMKQYESNQGRAMAIAHAYLNDIAYADFVNYVENLEKITKQDIVGFTQKFMQNNYVVICKRQGPPEDLAKVEKPPITPVHINREDESSFFTLVREKKIAEVAPEFLDYSKDLSILHPEGPVRILYKENTENRTFTYAYHFRMGRFHDKEMNFAMGYLPFLGTSAHTAEQIKQEFYRMACAFNINSADEETTISISGLSENFVKALALLEELLADAQPDPEALSSRIANTLKSRIDAKANQNEIFTALVSYGTFGAESPYKHVLTESELRALPAGQLTGNIHDLMNIDHEILYYGPEKPSDLVSLISKYHKVPGHLRPVPSKALFREKETLSNKVLFAPYEAKQARLQTILKEGRYDASLAPEIALFNMYFGGNIVFQELREKRALAYTATSRYQEPPDLEKSCLNMGYIATQNDKIFDAFRAFDDLFDSVPESMITFNVSKSALVNRICTERIRRMNVIWNFLNAEKLGLARDIRRDIFSQVWGMSLEDVAAFGRRHLKNKAKTYLVLGSEGSTDFASLAKFGTVTKLTLSDLFGW
jgi:predicted Zn-dependent peptidase